MKTYDAIVNEAVAKLLTAGVGPCATCGGVRFELQIVGIGTVAIPFSVRAHDCFPTATRTCQRCGAMVMHNLLVLGVSVE